MSIARYLHPEPIAPSMVKSMFSQLKENGYSDGQIVSLSTGLLRLINDNHQDLSAHHPRLRLLDDEAEPENTEVQAESLGSISSVPEAYEALCSEGWRR